MVDWTKIFSLIPEVRKPDEKKAGGEIILPSAKEKKVVEKKEVKEDKSE